MNAPDYGCLLFAPIGDSAFLVAIFVAYCRARRRNRVQSKGA
jgi:hypothetical protein